MVAMSEPTKSFTIRVPYSLYLKVREREEGMNAFIVKALQERMEESPPRRNECHSQTSIPSPPPKT